MTATDILGLLGSLGLTVGLLGLAFRWIRRFSPGGAGRAPIPMRVLGRVATGPRQGVALLRLDDRVLVISVNDRGSQLLTELTGEALTRALASDAVGVVPLRTAVRRRALPAWLPLVLALFLVPAVGASQAPTLPQDAEVGVSTQGSPAAVRPPSLSPPQVGIAVEGAGGNSLRLSGAVGIVVLLGALTLLPTLFLLMTSFTRFLIVLHFLRSALGTQTTPPGQLIVAIAVLLTGIAMNPVIQEANQNALQPYLEGTVTQAEAYTAALAPFRRFMLDNTRLEDLEAFADMSALTDVETVDELPMTTIMGAFITSELRAAFQIGFVMYLPFVIIDLIVASVLMSLGMFMLPPVMISLPFKLLLFVLADGWSLVVQSLVASLTV